LIKCAFIGFRDGPKAVSPDTIRPRIYFLRAFETLGVTETRRAAQHTAYTRVDGWLTLGTYYRDGLGFVSLPDPGPGKEQLLRGVGC